MTPVPPRGLRGYVLKDGSSEVIVLEVPRSLEHEDRLSRAEHEVVALARAGHSNAEIASLRSTSERTVANQLASAYKKLSVAGRGGLR